NDALQTRDPGCIDNTGVPDLRRIAPRNHVFPTPQVWFHALRAAPRPGHEASREQPVHEPARLRRLALVETLAIEPEARALAALDAEIVACQHGAGSIA